MRRVIESMASRCVRLSRRLCHRLGYDLVKLTPRAGGETFPPDFTRDEIDDVLAARAFTLTSSERMVTLTRAVTYLVEHDIPGDFVECGVARRQCDADSERPAPP